MRSSTSSRISPGSGVRDPSSAISHISEQKSTTPTTTIKGTRPSNFGASEGTWKSSSARASSRSISSYPKQSPDLDSQALGLLSNHSMRSPNIRQSSARISLNMTIPLFMTLILLPPLYYQIKLYSALNYFQPTPLKVQCLYAPLWVSPLLGDGNTSNSLQTSLI